MVAFGRTILGGSQSDLVFSGRGSMHGNRSGGGKLQTALEQGIESSQGAKNFVALALRDSAISQPLSVAPVAAASVDTACNPHHIQPLILRILDRTVKIAVDSTRPRNHRSRLGELDRQRVSRPFDFAERLDLEGADPFGRLGCAHL